MSWTTCYNHTSIEAAHRGILTEEHRPFVVVAHSSTHWGRNLWTSFLLSDGRVSTAVWLLRGDPDGGCWSHKAVGEIMGPYHLDIPLKVWDTLSPTTDKHARDWRARVRNTRLIAGPGGPRPATVRRWIKRTGHPLPTLEKAADRVALALGQPLEDLSGFAVGLENTGLLGPGLHSDRTVRAFGDFLLDLSRSIA